MKLIVGLGNPGQEYEKTRHNLGFMVLNSLAEQWGVHFDSQTKLKSDLLVTMHHDETIILAKPQTFMNLSGSAVQKIAHFYKLDPGDVWIVSDDLDLTFGSIRIRRGGSSGGHNGLKDIIEKIGEDFVRLRVGIGNNHELAIPSEDYVLQRFSTDEEKQLPEIIQTATHVIEQALVDGVEHTSKKVS